LASPLGSGLSALLAVLACSLNIAMAQEPEEDERAVPTFAELEAAGAVIGDIRIDSENIFDLADARENNAVFGFINRLHIGTRPQVIRKQLLFKSGDRVSARVIDETERLLRANSYFYDVFIRPVAFHDGLVDIDVRTRDTWSFVPSLSVSRAGGFNNGSLGFRDSNFLGTGVRVAVSAKSSTDSSAMERTGSQLEFLYPNAFDGHTAIAYKVSSFSDGKSQAASIERPFYALDTRRAAALSTMKEDRIVQVFGNGDVVAAQYRRRRETAEVSGGWSSGLIDGWAQRYSVGLAYEEARYSADPGDALPADLPADRTLVGPFVRYDLVEDDFRKFTNLNQIARVEIVPLGLNASLRLGRALPAFGSTQYATIYSGTVSKGAELPADGLVLASAGISGEHAGGRSDRQVASGSAMYYLRQQGGSVLFVSINGARVRYSSGEQQLSLGGDSGLRGYPARQQNGDRRVLFTAEQRFYSDVYPFRLFRLGGAVFYDAGRAWGGPFDGEANVHWLSDIGFGLRILSARSSSGTTLHLDFAFPIRREEGVRSYEFSFMSKTSF
jgi:outer membrane protein assembly factor BamA